ncbi:MAG: hypothetical protein ACE5KM_14645 [Planctomycetaceae bacterium]
MLQDFLIDLQGPTVSFLGILCVLVFLLNGALLAWLIVRKSGHGLARCPKCGRTVECPHCSEDDESAVQKAESGEPRAEENSRS